ncbi:DNA-binding transcriptional regulator, XRE-family HTH domain [Oceanobacillus limi]|uniref:DNA-binding transcriptional regulator, XRE-family HTH domain n=1 Tax=Oceanobacillus limi TaxID=930131 RepID=A0A1I0HMG9_9BACI|nr:helix-turn-helix transcriptional regulator [Oceanobacillus limi]SET84337.1 DNA-binding transcriptional regulator, XRE-family HTH domain [Oceanobacillus limi]
MKWEPKIGKIRRAKGLRQNHVADSIHVSYQSLSAWERGEAYPKAHYLFDLAEILECKVDDLYKRKEDKE